MRQGKGPRPQALAQVPRQYVAHHVSFCWPAGTGGGKVRGESVGDISECALREGEMSLVLA